jgi:hypothetical protein
VGLDGDEAALDIRNLRSLLDCIRLVRRTAMQTAVRMLTTGVMLALLAASLSSSRSSAGDRSCTTPMSPNRPRRALPANSIDCVAVPRGRVFGFGGSHDTTTTFHRHWLDVPESAWCWPELLARRDRLQRHRQSC